MAAKAEQRGTNMRWSIVAGLIMGVSLAVHSALGAHARAKAGHAARPARVHEPAPWFVALNESHGGWMRGNLAAPPFCHSERSEE